jgi:capsular exopolysaccharide synthesis family protein
MHGNLRQREKSQTKAPEALQPRLWDEARIDLRAIIGLLRRHKWTVAVTVVVIVGLAAVIAAQLPKKYTATTLVVVDSRDAQLVGFQTGIGDPYAETSLVDTEVEIAKSSKVLQRAAAALDLGNSPDYEKGPGLLDMLASMVGMGSESPPAERERRPFASLSPTEQASIVERLAQSSAIARLGLTNIISISATTSSPDSAARTANALADAYLTEQIDAKLSSTARAAAFLQERVSSLAREIAEGESELDRFIEENIARHGSAAAKELLAKLAVEARQRDATGATITDFQAAIAARDFVRLASLDPEGSELAKRRQELVAQLSDTDDAARLADARRQLDELDAQLVALAERQLGTLQEQVAASTARSDALREQMGAALVDLHLPQDVTVTLFQLQRDVETRRVLYDSFLAKLQQVEQQTGFNIPDSRVIAAAVPPLRPSFPPTRAILAAAFFLSIGAGIGLAFLREHFIGGITSVDQLEAMSGMPVVAAVPRYNGDPDKRPDQAIINQPLSAYSEAIRRAGLGIMPFGDNGRRCIFVTSALPGEGKTTLALSLARQAALTGSSTLLIDADLRHPSVHGYLNESVDDGLIAYLSQPAGSDSTEVTIVKEPSSGVDFVLGAAASAGSTDTLLMSSRFDDLIRFARGRYETIIIDTPPIGLVVDATIVARHCDAGVFVVRYASTGQNVVRSSLRELMDRTDLPIFCVLNMVAQTDTYEQYGKYRRYYQPRAA